MPVPTIKILINDIHTAGNPIIAKLYAGTNKAERYRIYQWGTTDYTTLIFEGIVFTASTYADVDITSLFADLRKNAGVTKFKIALVDDTDVEYYPLEFQVYGGAISKLLIRQMNTFNIFQKKLSNNDVNFFLSTRTNNTVIAVAENELMPIGFYAKGHVFGIKADGTTVYTFIYTAGADDSLQTIDFAAVRLTLIAEQNKLVSVFDIMSNTGYVCSVMITEGIETNYYFKFKNSWGMWEKVALHNDVDYTPSMGEAQKISNYDTVVSDFVKKQQRKEITNIYTATTGYKNADERLFLLDLLQSDEVVFIAHGLEYAANITTDTNLFGSTKGEPGTVNFKIELLDVDTNYSPLILEDDLAIISTAEYEDITSAGLNILI